jgi:hypothetical protein
LISHNRSPLGGGSRYASLQTGRRPIIFLRP